MPKSINPNLICVGCMQPLKKELGVCPHCGTDNQQYRNAIEQLPIRSTLNGKYLIGRALGQGGFGITYLGMDLTLEVRVAIKEYYPGNCAARQTIGSMVVSPYSGEASVFFAKGKERYLDEAKTLAKMKGLENVVDVRDYFEANGTAYIVMEYVDGRTLKHIIEEKGKLPLNDALALMQPLIGSIVQMHALNVIHRDISPDNIMIRPDNRAVLLDFGAARAYLGDQQLSAYSTAVKNGFAPPEQYQNEQLGPWTDVYAMCATLYNLVSGVVPTQSLARMTQDNKPVESLESHGVHVPAWFEDTLRDGLALNVADRIGTMEALYKRLYEQNDRNNDDDKSKRSRAMTWIAAALVVANLAQAGFWLTRGTAAPTTPVSTSIDLTQPLSFANAAVEQLVRDACGKPSGSILPADAAMVTTLSLRNAGMTDIGFLRAFTGLMTLDISGNSITDLTPLSGLTQLQRLYANHNLIADVTPLSDLTHLTELWLHDNRIADAAPLSGLTALTALDLSANRLSDATALAPMSALQSLWLQDNSLSDLIGLNSLSGLTMLNAGNNALSSITPLSALPELRTVYLYNNTITDDAPLSHLRQQSNATADLTGNPCAQ